MLHAMQILDEFVEAVMSRWPKAVLQFEDFQLPYAHPLLQRYKDQHLVFNDDIQVSLLHSSFQTWSHIVALCHSARTTGVVRPACPCCAFLRQQVCDDQCVPLH